MSTKPKMKHVTIPVLKPDQILVMRVNRNVPQESLNQLAAGLEKWILENKTEQVVAVDRTVRLYICDRDQLMVEKGEGENNG